MFFAPADEMKGAAGPVGAVGADGMVGPAGDAVAKMAVEFAVTPELLAALGVPADQATPESVLAAAQALSAKAGEAEQGMAQLTALQTQLDAANQQLAAAAAAQAAKELAEELSGYELGEPETAALGAMPPEHRAVMLAKMPKKAAAPVGPGAKETENFSRMMDGVAPVTAIPPPEPIHSPGQKAAETSPADKASAAEALIAEIRKKPGTRFQSYTDARAEARRQKPDLFA